MASYKTLGDKRLAIMLLLVFLALGIVILKLFYMQVIKNDHYVALAQEGRQGYRELEARRGEVFIRDFHSGEHFRLATNITLDTIFADPWLIDDPQQVKNQIVDIIFDEELELEREEARLREKRKELDAELTEEEVSEILKPRPLSELRAEFEADLLDKLSTQIREEILLVQDPSVAIRKAVRKLNLSGIEVTDRAIRAFPKLIGDQDEYGIKLAGVLNIPEERLKAVLEGKNRYVVLRKKARPEIVEEIQALKDVDKETFRGIGFQEETYRYYPEKTLAAQVLGFLNTEREGVYGLEASFDDELRGEAGIFKAQIDGAGRQITTGSDVVIESARDGADVYLTIDRSIQKKVENLLERAVVDNQADSGQVIVMDPRTGRIMAMAHYPTFDPNEFWTALDTEEIFLEEEDRENIVKYNYGNSTETYLIVDEETDERVRLFPIETEDGDVYYEKYKNNAGSGVYRNRVVSDTYEPGSVFKPIAMSIGIDAAGITPDETVDDVAPIKVDEFTIDNALGKHWGTITMTQVLETSNNIGMAHVAKRIGNTLFGSYLKRYGFGRTTDIEFLNEHNGKIESSQKWAESELVTHAFGQGIAVTPIQMVTAVAALANDGVLMEPYIVDKVTQEGDVIEREPRIVHQVISPATAETLKAMMASVVENGQLRGRIWREGYSIAGKTGTSQTYKNGKPLEGAGTTITTFAGFAPVEDPQFVVLVKVDKPRTSQWATAVAAPLFSDIADYLIEYLAIPPGV